MHTNYDTIPVISVHATIVTSNVIKCIDILGKIILYWRIICPYFFIHKLATMCHVIIILRKEGS